MLFKYKEILKITRELFSTGPAIGIRQLAICNWQLTGLLVSLISYLLDNFAPKWAIGNLKEIKSYMASPVFKRGVSRMISILWTGMLGTELADVGVVSRES